MPLILSYSAEAVAQLGAAKTKAEAKPSGGHAANYNALRKIIEEIVADPQFAFAHQNMLRGQLANVLRVKHGRERIFYIASSKLGRACVLLIGYRKSGDKNDAYEVFQRLLRRGSFDAHFAELGVTKPQT